MRNLGHWSNSRPISPPGTTSFAWIDREQMYLGLTLLPGRKLWKVCYCHWLVVEVNRGSCRLQKYVSRYTRHHQGDIDRVWDFPVEFLWSEFWPGPQRSRKDFCGISSWTYYGEHVSYTMTNFVIHLECQSRTVSGSWWIHWSGEMLCLWHMSYGDFKSWLIML